MRPLAGYDIICAVDPGSDDSQSASADAWARGDDTPAGDGVQIVGLRHFQRLMPLLHRLDEIGCARDSAGNRQLFMSDYCAVVILYLFNPMIDSLRSLQRTLGLAAYS